jgi:hypothetical protein
MEDKPALSPAGRSLATPGQRMAANLLDGACGCVSGLIGLGLGAWLSIGLARSAHGLIQSLIAFAFGLFVALAAIGIGLPLILYSVGFSVGRPIVGITRIYEDGNRVPLLRSRRSIKRIYLVSRAQRKNSKRP